MLLQVPFWSRLIPTTTAIQTIMTGTDMELKAKYSKILKANDIDDVIGQITLTKPDLVGQHMGSITEAARIDFENGERPPLELFLKKRLPDSGVAFMDESMKGIMLKEGKYLKEFSQELHTLCKERTNGMECLTAELFPKTYFYDEDVIVMEDLTKRGYSILPKSARQDFKDASTVVRHLAKLHAATFVLIESTGGLKTFLDNNPNFEEEKKMIDMMAQAFEQGYDVALAVLKNSSHEEKDEKYDILSKYKGKLGDAMRSSIEAESLFSCVLHGDCWNNNMMFNDTREKIVLVDFQMPRVGSPNLDLSYFMFTSTRSEVRRRWKELLQVYFDSLKSNVESLGKSFEYKFEDFVKDFIRKSKLGFFFGFLLIIGMEAMGGHDTSKCALNVIDAFTTMVSKWLEDNPDKSQAASESMISMVNDYLLFAPL